MLTLEAARRIGINACIDKLGRSFVLQNRKSSTASYSAEIDEDGKLYCFVGVDNSHQKEYREPGVLVLDSKSKFPYHASCHVNCVNGMVVFIECVLPS